MEQKICLVTGATNGIGKVTATELARMGASVVLVGRDEQKTHATVSEIQTATGNDKVDYIIADLSVGKQVVRVADVFKSRYDRLHVLVNNAGGIFFNQIITTDKQEMTFALNHMSYFTLTNALLEVLVATGTSSYYARIVNVSSVLHAVYSLDFDQLQMNGTPYNGYKAYCQSKLMNVMFTYELHRRLQSQQAYVTANTLHPGVIKSGFATNNRKGRWGIATKVMLALAFWRMSEAQGAKTQLYLATSPEVEGVSGAYFNRCKPRKTSRASLIENDWARLWAYSEHIDKTRLELE